MLARYENHIAYKQYVCIVMTNLFAGAILLCEYNRCILQDLHPRDGVQGAHMARILKFGLQPYYLFHI